MNQTPIFIGHEIYRHSSYGARHPLRVPRVSTVMDLSRALGWLPDEQYRVSPRAKPKALWSFHDPAYIGALARAEKRGAVTPEDRARFHLGTPSNPVFPEMFRRPATSAGGSLLAGELLANGGIVYHPAGGTHHGMPDRANGFCYLNDPVLAIQSLRRNGAQRIVYVDIDAHHSDGVEVAFAGDPDSRLVSVHEAGLWPRTGALLDDGGGNCFNLPVPRGLNDEEMGYIVNGLILPAINSFAADALVLQCGADALDDDPQSHLSLSNSAYWQVVRAVKHLAPRLLVLGGGGYNPWSVGRCWSGIWGILNGFEPPDALADSAESVLRALRFDNHSKGRNPPEHWFTTLADAPRNGAVRDEIKRDVALLQKRL